MKPLEKWMKKENLGVLLLVGLLLLVIALPARQENENTITEENTQDTDSSEGTQNSHGWWRCWSRFREWER